ncbi:putative integral membrane protein (TIGR00698 family) [Trinickia symbiotica]|uniref:YeiH family putative sulfate export transporter n=1 Tax=Trinickia symbiotica TaxID=863227 RepID=A0A2N7WQS9_9BURK|nr:YeiH family protein [Trinickia symbiotica]PMS31760.1 YeiH family putative sulfate export transporter [Trinickia symbiotica]PPK41889.1 putative integral membrane protein (TIGR00698 family) [Trinickia symbiotica]
MSTPSMHPAAHAHSAAAAHGPLNGILFVALFAAAVTRLAAMPVIAGLGVSPLIVGIVAGAVYGNTLRAGMPAHWAAGVNFSARRLLRIAVAFFGLRVSLQEIAQVGLPGLTVSLLVVVSTLAIGIWVGTKLLKLDRDTAILTAAGSAICGAAAVLAFESTLNSKPEKSAVAVGSVVLFGTLSMFVYPLAYRAGWLHLDTAGIGLFFGGTIHEVAQVVGAASNVSSEATHVATIVKMTRVMLLVPVLLVLGVWLARTAARGTGNARAPRKVTVPWFALGFLACVIANSLHVLPSAATQAVNALDTFALTMAMTALGIETQLSQVRKAGPRALATGFILYVWLAVGGLAITWGVERVLG